MKIFLKNPERIPPDGCTAVAASTSRSSIINPFRRSLSLSLSLSLYVYLSI